jgi:tRNA pseudouridine55 synthase
MYNTGVIINVYKPRGITSFDVVFKVRKALGIKKVGHAGTLDPLAEGVLIVLTDKDTKKQSEFMNMEKEYIAEVGFGIYSETYDMEKLPKFVSELPPEKLKNEIDVVLKKFIGKQMQEVPMYSAVSVDGQRLYKLARKGKTLEKVPSKEITIRSIELLDIGEKEIQTDVGLKTLLVIKIKVTCSSGTYIRSLVRDIGKAFQTDAVMLSLVRSRIGDFLVTESKPLLDLS